MTTEGNIKIKNIFHMLAYAFKDVLNERKYKDLGLEDFEHQSDLLATILIKGIDSQMKRGMNKGYVPTSECKNCLSGKINLSASIKKMTTTESKLICEYDDFTANIEVNKILKTTMHLLLKDENLSPNIKKKLRKTLLFFGDIDLVNPKDVRWSSIHYHRNNMTYRLLLYICELVINRALMTERGRRKNLSEYFDDQKLFNLFQNFVNRYYYVHYRKYWVKCKGIRWDLDDERDYLLPQMNTDVMLESEKSTLIIDTKFYTERIVTNYRGSELLSSDNLYQMYAYVKNKASEWKRNDPHRVDGLILYAKTEVDENLDVEYSISGNRIFVKTLNMNDDWENIEIRLKGFVELLY